jgi:hypothetical protein
MAGMVIVFTVGAWRLASKYINRGEDLNKKAWESSYIERKQPVPESGPREGYWGDRLGPKERDEQSVWREPEIHLAGLIEIDSQGLQYYRSSVKNRFRILIIGGSVAAGANASRISTNYFNVIGRELERSGLETEIVIAAAGAWKSIQEVRALEYHLQRLHPDVVIFLNGLNDLTSGSTSKTLYGEPTTTRDGSKWTELYHEHDYDQRVADYLANMKGAGHISAAGRSRMLVVLQPSLNERTVRTKIEDEILKMSLEPHSSSVALTKSYTDMRKGLNALALTEEFHFLDCSRVLDVEKETVFTDIWHFTDFGHHVLGRIMAHKIAEIINNGLK